MATALTPADAQQWQAAAYSDAWLVPVCAVGLSAALLAVSPAPEAPFVVGGLLAAVLLLWLWPALGTAVAVGVAVTMPAVVTDELARLAIVTFAATSALLLGVRARGQLVQLRIVEQSTHTQDARRGPRSLGPWLWARGLAASVAVAAMAGGAVLGWLGLGAAGRMPWLLALALPLLALALVVARLVVAPYRRPNRWAGSTVEARVTPDGRVAVRVIGDRSPFARYLASLPTAFATGTLEPPAPAPEPAPYDPPDAWQTVRRYPDPPVTESAVAAAAEAAEWVTADLVGDVRDGGWAAVVIDGTTLSPISPLRAPESRAVLTWIMEQVTKEPWSAVFAVFAAILGGMSAVDNLPAAIGTAPLGRITITANACGPDGCVRTGQFVSDDGRLVVGGVTFDRDVPKGSVHRAALIDGIDGPEAHTPSSHDFALWGWICLAAASVLALWLWRLLRHWGRELRE